MPWQQNKRTGEVREVDANGQPMAAPQRGAIPIGPRNNHQANADSLARDDFDRRARNDADDRDRKARQDKLDKDKYVADLYTKGLMLGPNGQLVQIPGWSPPKSAEAAVDGNNRAGRLDSLTNQINRTQELFAQGPGATKPWSMGSLGDFNPYDGDNARFNTAGASLSQQGLGAFRVPGSGTVSDRDAIMFDRANLPQSGTQDASNEEILRGLRSRVEEEYNSLGLPAPQWVSPQAAQDQNAPPMVGTSGGGNGPQGGGNDGMPSLAMQNWSNGGNAQPQAVASGTLLGPKQRKEYDYGAQAHFQKMVMSGAGADDLQAEAQRMGFDAFDPAALNAVVDWHRRFPKDNRPMINPPLKQVDQTTLERVSQGGPGAAGIGLANAGSFGVLGGIAPDKMEMARAAHPYAEMAGEVGGAIWGTNKLGGLINRIPGGLAAKASPLTRNIATDATYGGIYGGASNPDNPGAGAAMGLLGGAGGSFLGNGAASMIGRGLSGVRSSPTIARLREQGVTPTLGQIMRGRAFDNGGKSIVAGFEDAVSNTPGAGVFVNTARTRALEQGNTAGYRIVGNGAPINGVGVKALDQLDNVKTAAYGDALNGVSLPANEARFASQVSRADDTGRQIDGLRGKGDFAYVMDHELAPIFNGGGSAINGRQIQDSLRLLQGQQRSFTRASNGPAPDPAAKGVANALGGVEGALTGLTARHAPGAIPKLKIANRIYRGQQVLEEAANHEGQVFTGPQLMSAIKANGNKFGQRGLTATSKSPLFQHAEDMTNALPNKVPPTGVNAAPMLAGAGLLAGGVNEQTGYDSNAIRLAAGLAMLSAPYTKTGSAGVAKLLLDRPETLKALGTAVRKRKGLFGTAAVPLMLESQN